MAWDANKNAIYFQRLQNAAVAFQLLREECLRLRNIYTQEIAPGGVKDPAYQSVAGKGTTADADTLQSYLTDFMTLNDGTGALSSFARWGQILPFVDTTQA